MAMMNEMEYRTIGKALAGGYRAAVYCRLSKDDDLQGESASIANQRDMLEKYCEKQGWEGFLIMICVGIYAVLIQSIAFSDDIIGSIWGVMGYTVLLCFTLFKTGSLAKGVFSAH